MGTLTKASRRDFLKIAGTTAGGLVIGFNWFSCDSPKVEILSTEQILSQAKSFNSYLSIAPSGDVVIYSPNPELGQNIKTSFPMVVAEELDADWEKVRVVQANLDPANYDRQLTGGSGAMPHSWERLRKAGATANLSWLLLLPKLGMCPHQKSPSIRVSSRTQKARKRDIWESLYWKHLP